MTIFVLITILLIIYLLIKKKIIFLLQLFLIPILIYFLSYTPFFFGNHVAPGKSSVIDSFVELQRQMWWYHTNLRATHPYQSRPEQWTLNLRPVWLYVDYKGNSVSNIYTLESPLIAWFGLASVFLVFYELLKRFSIPKFLVLSGYSIFIFFGFISPRIMFNYHYLPSTAFLTIALGLTLNEILKFEKGKFYLAAIIFLFIILFIYFYPLWTGIYIPTDFSNSHFWLKSWK